MPPRKDPAGFLPLSHLTYHLLLALAESPSHAYGLVQSIRTQSDGRVDPGTGSFYSLIKQAVEAGLVRQGSRPTSGDARRSTTYEITPLGRRVLEADARRLESQLTATRRLLPSLRRPR